MSNKVATDDTLQRIAAALESSSIELDGTASGYRSAMRKFFLARGCNALTTFNDLCDEWYAQTRDDWCGYTEFYQTDVSAVTYGTKGGDNAALTCEPSTDSAAGTDDYAGLPLFACVDCNWEVDAETLEPVITAIEGVCGNFKRKDTSTFVGVLQMSAYYFWTEGDSTYIRGYSATPSIPYANVAPLPECVKVSDNTFREWMVHGKYGAALVDGKLTCCSGVAQRGYMSVNNTHTYAKAIGSQYSGQCACDFAFPIWMTWIKYGSLTLDGIMNGCNSMNYQYYALVAEEDVQRVLISVSNAANLEVGMNVLIGNYSSSSASVDRSTSDIYSISGNTGCKITAIESVTVDDTEYSAVYVDCDSFSTGANGSATDGTTYISSFAWDTGLTDGVLGNDGSPTSNTDSKRPFKIQGIEMMTGVYEAVADITLYCYTDDDGTYWQEPYIANASANQTSSITSNYTATGLTIEQASTAGWTYVKKLDIEPIFFPAEIAGSSSTYTCDGYYRPAAVTGTRALFARGGLSSSSNAGVSALYGGNTLSNASWLCGSRLSPNGNRGEWAA